MFESSWICFQYPLRSSKEPYTADSILAARVCGGGEGVELDVKVRPQGENYSSSRGENYARMVAMGSPDGGYKRYCTQHATYCRWQWGSQVSTGIYTALGPRFTR